MEKLQLLGELQRGTGHKRTGSICSSQNQVSEQTLLPTAAQIWRVPTPPAYCGKTDTDNTSTSSAAVGPCVTEASGWPQLKHLSYIPPLSNAHRHHQASRGYCSLLSEPTFLPSAQDGFREQFFCKHMPGWVFHQICTLYLYCPNEQTLFKLSIPDQLLKKQWREQKRTWLLASLCSDT